MIQIASLTEAHENVLKDFCITRGIVLQEELYRTSPRDLLQRALDEEVQIQVNSGAIGDDVKEILAKDIRAVQVGTSNALMERKEFPASLAAGIASRAAEAMKKGGAK